MNPKLPTLIGAATGLVVFLAVGLLPALVYGGYAGVLLAGGIFGTPIHGWLPRVVIVLGAVLGVTGVASLFALGGAALGAAVQALVRSGASERADAHAPAPKP